MTAPSAVRAACLRCGVVAADPYAPCPGCLEEGVAANHVALDLGPPTPAGSHATPLRALASEPRLFLKDERGGMTWSWKDRLATAAAAHAAQVGADTIAVCSSGNHGAAMAAAASARGLRCVVLSMPSIAPAMARLVEGCGGSLVVLADVDECWAAMREGIAGLGWYPGSNVHDPPIGSNPFATAGYRSIAAEIVEAMGVPDWVVVPVGFGDGLSGIAHGFLALAAARGIPTPRMLAAVTSDSLPEALRTGADQPRARASAAPAALSIACPQSTYQAVHALRATDGVAELVEDRDALAARRELGRREGVFLELSSAVAHAAVLAARRRGVIAEHESVVVVGTSPGLKDQPLPGDGGGPVPVEGGLGAVLASLGLEPVAAPGP
jgi:threonine synthase